MLTQHEKRKNLVFMLYMAGFYDKEEADSQLDIFLENEIGTDEENRGDIAYLKERYARVKEKLGVIDPMIASVAEGWSLKRMGKTDLAILRLAVFELFYDDEIPSAVAINEAVKLAAGFGGENSSPAFINGILGRLERSRTVDE